MRNLDVERSDRRPRTAAVALIVLYFYLGWKLVGGRLWQRILGAR
ncbi:hypothetical protein [Bradyrhizobium sp. 41S5]|nr:hypothetical protein [Bradyrhizobium sp. 41S5]